MCKQSFCTLIYVYVYSKTSNQFNKYDFLWNASKCSSSFSFFTCLCLLIQHYFLLPFVFLYIQVKEIIFITWKKTLVCLLCLFLSGYLIFQKWGLYLHEGNKLFDIRFIARQKKKRMETIPYKNSQKFKIIFQYFYDICQNVTILYLNLANWQTFKFVWLGNHLKHDGFRECTVVKHVSIFLKPLWSQEKYIRNFCQSYTKMFYFKIPKKFTTF